MKFDIIGDIHGCYDELLSLIDILGYKMKNNVPVHPDGRLLAFVGDAMDRGPNSLETLMLLFRMQDAGILHYSPGNHCNKFYRFAKGNHVEQVHGLETTVAELNALPSEKRLDFLKRYRKFYEALPLYQVLDDEKLVIAHAGIRQNMIGAPESKKIRVFVIYGDVTGERHPDGRPVRRDWAKTYKGAPFIVYGHTPVRQARFLNNTVNIDTGCVFGGALTAIRYPEMEILDTPSLQPFMPDRFTVFD